MSENTITESTPVPTVKRTRKPRSQSIEHSAAILAYAKSKQIDEVRAGKQFRAVLRANPDVRTQTTGKAHVKNTPWGSHNRAKLAKLFPNVKAYKG